MEINNNDNDFTYTYKVVSGISKVKGGIKVLKDLAFPEEIINTAAFVITNLNL